MIGALSKSKQTKVLVWLFGVEMITIAQKMKFSMQDFFSKCNQIRRKLRIWSHLLKKPLTGTTIFCVVYSKGADKQLEDKNAYKDINFKETILSDLVDKNIRIFTHEIFTHLNLLRRKN